MPRKSNNQRVTTEDVDNLHVQLVDAMSFALKHPPKDDEGNDLPQPAALLACISKFLSAAGVRPIPESPLMRDMDKLADILPFKTNDA